MSTRISRRAVPRAVGVLSAVLLLGLAAPALGASQRVAVTAFQGPGAEQLRAAMVARISPRVQVLPAGQTLRAVRTAGSRSPAAWAAVARRLNAVALVDGRISTGRG